MSDHIFHKRTTRDDLEALISICSNYVAMDAAEVVMEAIQHVKAARALEPPVKGSRMEALEARWYQSLPKAPDYSVYSDPFYLCDVWACWCVYSSKSVASILQKNGLGSRSVRDAIGDVSSVLDMGCGIGFTTEALAQIFPEARVIGTNVRDSFQFGVCEDIAKKGGFAVVEDHRDAGRVDVMFASEYFEHFEASLEHVYHAMTENRPRWLIVANGYGGRAIGHFHEYRYRGRIFSAQQTRRDFGKMMRHLGYTKHQTNIWNDRPAIWERSKP